MVTRKSLFLVRWLMLLLLVPVHVDSFEAEPLPSSEQIRDDHTGEADFDPMDFEGE